MKGKIVGGKFGEVILRQKKSEELEIGELLVAEKNGKKLLLQVTDLGFGSQISQQQLELISGMEIEEGLKAEFIDEELRIYNTAMLKTIKQIDGGSAKILPEMFSEVREIKKEDIDLRVKDSPLFLGKLRSGSKVLEIPVELNGKDVLSHHILIPATTGKGKSNLTTVLLADITDKSYAGMLVLDPHDEYYSRLENKSVIYYSPNPPAGQNSLKINKKLLRPEHFNGVINWSSAQRDALHIAFKKYGNEWIDGILNGEELKGIQEGTLAVVKRKLSSLDSTFDSQAGEAAVKEILSKLEEGRTVIINTSQCSSRNELLIGSLITSEVFNYYKKLKLENKLDGKPVVSVVLEEAPRVLGKEVLERGSNIFSTIAREGRKFKVGLIAITQLPSLIPREVLANMNTKIVLGIEMQPERQAIIESAAQDLSSDSRNIASLDKGEAIITSNFAPFAIPIKIPLFKKEETTKVERQYDFINQ